MSIEAAKRAEERKMRQAEALLGEQDPALKKKKTEAVGSEDDFDEDEADDDQDRDDDDADEQDQDDDDDDDEGQDLREQIEQLQQELRATQGRVAPSQRQAEEMRRLWDTERESRERDRAESQRLIADMQSQLESRNIDQRLEDLISDDMRDSIDPEVLKAMIAVAKGAAEANRPNIDVDSVLDKKLKQRDADRVDQYRRRLLTDPKQGLSNLYVLADDPKFQAWTQQEENEGFDIMVNSLLNAKSTEEIDKYGKAISRRIERFKKSSKKSNATKQSTDPKTSLESRMRRSTPRSLSNEEQHDAIKRAKALSRSTSKADHVKAQEILNSLH